MKVDNLGKLSSILYWLYTELVVLKYEVRVVNWYLVFWWQKKSIFGNFVFMLIDNFLASNHSFK